MIRDDSHDTLYCVSLYDAVYWSTPCFPSLFLHPLLPLTILPSGYTNHSHATTLSTNVSTVERSGDWVLVKWEDVDQPSASDWIGLYSVPDDFNDDSIDPTERAPIKFQVKLLLRSDCSALQTIYSLSSHVMLSPPPPPPLSLSLFALSIPPLSVCQLQ